MIHFNLADFINQHVTGRTESLFLRDMEANRELLCERIAGKSVLVIGGAGTIGAAFISAILPFRPGRLYIVDINENGLTELIRDLRSTAGLALPKDIKTYPVNFSDPVFEKLFRREGPYHIVANFAAHKHVRSEKDPYSIEAMLENNVLRAKRLLDLLLESPPERFFCVSTDKAANPVNVMGASKKLMEDLVLAYSRHLPVTTARFANVAFSNGSLPAGFLERLMKRQPLSAPADVERYFVSPEEAGQICLLACILGNSGEIFFPKLNRTQDTKRFSGIATALLQSFGYQPQVFLTEQEARLAAANKNGNGKYPVVYFTSDTSGEKPIEEFFTDGETIDMERFDALGVIKDLPAKSLEEIETIFDTLISIFQEIPLAKERIVSLLQDIIPSFEHSETGKNLDQRM